MNSTSQDIAIIKINKKLAKSSWDSIINEKGQWLLEGNRTEGLCNVVMNPFTPEFEAEFTSIKTQISLDFAGNIREQFFN